MVRRANARLAIVAILAGVLGAVPAQADHAPLGMTLFCLNFASQCEAGGPEQLDMSEALRDVLVGVNGAVNRAMRYEAETGVVDSWKIGGSSGDCEDFVLTKRALLIGEGMPAGALRIATTVTRAGEPHAVLVVRTSDGDFVLDNIKPEVLPLNDTGYRLQSMSGVDPLAWSPI